MDKRYQVFVSSTFRDLVDERQGILKAILELDHIPAGMELFPASDASAWQLIRDVIDASDYYVLVIGGRYGSIDQAGLGYTEKEYDYAVGEGKCVIPLLHQDPGKLTRDKTETSEAAWGKLQAFRAKVEKRHTCSYWTSAEDLKAQVILGLTAAIKRTPSVGWVRADQVPADATLKDVLLLRKRIVELEEQLRRDQSRAPAGTEDLLQGDDTFPITMTFTARTPGDQYPHPKDVKYDGTITPSIDDVFAAVSPLLINEASDATLRKAFTDYFESRARVDFGSDNDVKKKRLLEFHFKHAEVDTCIIQLRALGLIRESRKPRSVKDTRTYWAITEYGDLQMTRLRALKRAPPPPPTLGSATPTVPGP